MKKAMKQRRKTSDMILAGIALLLILPGILIYIWYGSTRLTVTQRSDILHQTVQIASGGSSCTLDIPAGKLSIQRPRRAALGSRYPVHADVRLEEPLRLISCTGTLPNWSLYLEAQTTLVGSNVQPYALIRQPAFDREDLKFSWTFTPEETVLRYQSHLYLRAIVMEQDQTIERWNLLVRDFPMENIALFGQPTVLWLVSGGVMLLLGALFLIILLQRRKR